MVDASLTDVQHLHAAYDVVPPCRNFGSLAMFEAIRRASSRVNSLAAARRPGSSSK
jgi:hypothetical protein